MSRRLLAIGAHAADFVWRAGGVLALTAQAGGTASVLSLSYGERGELAHNSVWTCGSTRMNASA